jgi:hypothetical protein
MQILRSTTLSHHMHTQKRLFLIGVLAYCVLLLMALVLWKERIVVLDDAGYTFDLVTNGGRFAVFHQRFIAALTQWMPFVGLRLGLPLGAIGVLYSLNIAVFYFACFLVCGLVFRHYSAALCVLLCGLLITTHTFYWTVSELEQGIALLFVVVAALDGKGRDEQSLGALGLSLLGIAMATVAYAHGLMLFVVSYVLLYLWLKQKVPKRSMLFTGGFYGLAVLVKMLFMSDPYDRHSLSGLRNFLKLFPNYFGMESMGYFLRQSTGSYCWLPVLFVICAGYYIKKGAFLRLGLMLAYCFGYLLFVTVTFPTVEANGFYHENLLIPMTVFVCLPFVFDVLPTVQWPVLRMAIVVLIVGSGLARVWNNRGFYQARLDWQRKVITRYSGKKVIVGEQHFPKDTLLMAWSSPYEFWLLSTLEREKTASILIAEDPDQYRYGLDNSRLFVPSFGTYKYADLPRQYFKFKDTVSTYTMVK